MNSDGVLGFCSGGEIRGFLNSRYSCPQGLGTRVVEFLIDNNLRIDEDTRKLMQIRVDNLTWVDDETAMSDTVRERYEHYSSPEGKMRRKSWFHLFYVPQNGVCLWEILAGRMEHIPEDRRKTKFVTWAYILDFENANLKVWRLGSLIAEKGFHELSWQWLLDLEKTFCGAFHGEFEVMENTGNDKRLKTY